ncbi:MAG: hypothetical protein AAF720_03660 [Pseudomonadota bacterium]
MVSVIRGGGKKSPEKIFLHIGCEKTGTTSVQRYFSENRARLSEQQILYPKSVGASNHFDLSVYCLDDNKITALRRRRQAVDTASINKARTDIEKAFRAECARVCPTRIVLSSEQLSSNVTTQQEIERLRSLLGDFGAPIEIILYVRRQDDLAVSSYSTQVKAGATYKFDTGKISSRNIKYNYEKMCKLWTQFPGDTRLTVRLYDRRVLAGGDVVTDICQLIGVDTDGFVKPPDANKTLDPTTLEVLRCLNTHLPQHGDPQNLRGNLQDIFASLSSNEKLTIADVEAEQIMTALRTENEWVRARYFSDLEFDPFEVRARGSKNTLNKDLSLDETLKVFAEVWTLKQKQLMASRADASPLALDRNVIRSAISRFRKFM